MRGLIAISRPSLAASVAVKLSQPLAGPMRHVVTALKQVSARMIAKRHGKVPTATKYRTPNPHATQSRVPTNDECRRAQEVLRRTCRLHPPADHLQPMRGDVQSEHQPGRLRQQTYCTDGSDV